VVMLQYLLSDEFDADSKRRDFIYYEARTTHKSSLSPSIYAIMGLEVGEAGRAYRNFMRTALVDLDDNQGNTDQGIHAAAMGGTWQAAVNGFAGMRLRRGRLCFDPRLPEHWRGMAFKINWRGMTVRVSVTRDDVEFSTDGSVEVEVRGKLVVLEPGKTIRVAFS